LTEGKAISAQLRDELMLKWDMLHSTKRTLLRLLARI